MTVLLNGRYRGRPVTGVERYADELLAELRRSGVAVEVIAPARPVSGPLGHAWEQVVLPARARGRGSLLSLCNFGPVAVADQLVVIHDVAPFLHPDGYAPAYVAAARRIQSRLARRCRVATVSERARADLADVLHVDAAEVAIVPPAVGAPFAPGDADRGGGRGHHCVVVGGHDPRKNVGFLLELWPEVHRTSGLELVVVGRGTSSTLHGGSHARPAGVRWVTDPDDVALAELYRTSRAVLSPSRYEGFGLPLLEAMACGTPFLATDTGAAAELAIDPDQQLLPLAPDAWIERLRAWAIADLEPLAAAGLARAGTRTWQASADALRRCLGGAPAPAGSTPAVPA